MIGKVCRRGTDVRRLLGYLFLEGQAGDRGLASDHADARLVAGYQDLRSFQPSRGADGRFDVRSLGALLNAPVLAGGVGANARPVYHLALSAAKVDRLLSDAEWADIAAEYVHRIGLAPRGDDAAVRWVAVRHAPDHVHVVATLVRQDGRRVFPRQDYLRSREASRAVEARYGLTTTAPVGGTSTPETTRAEWRKHAEDSARRQRQGRPAPAGPDREVLRSQVRVALAGSTSWEDFAERLSVDGVLVRPRYSTVNAGEITGYAVALRLRLSELDDGREPLWFSGGKLAPDLTLPRLRQRWADPDGTRDKARADSPANSSFDASGQRLRLTEEERSAAWAAASTAVRGAQAAVDAAAAGGRTLDQDPDALAAATAASHVLHAVSRLAEGKRGGPVRVAAEHYDRASRPPRRQSAMATPTSRALRGSARGLLKARVVQRPELRQLLRLMNQLATLADTIAQLRQAQQQAARARAGLLAAEQLTGKIRMIEASPFWDAPQGRTPTRSPDRIPGPVAAGWPLPSLSPRPPATRTEPRRAR